MALKLKYIQFFRDFNDRNEKVEVYGSWDDYKQPVRMPFTGKQYHGRILLPFPGKYQFYLLVDNETKESDPGFRAVLSNVIAKSCIEEKEDDGTFILESIVPAESEESFTLESIAPESISKQLFTGHKIMNSTEEKGSRIPNLDMIHENERLKAQIDELRNLDIQRQRELANKQQNFHRLMQNVATQQKEEMARVQTAMYTVEEERSRRQEIQNKYDQQTDRLNHMMMAQTAGGYRVDEIIDIDNESNLQSIDVDNAPQEVAIRVFGRFKPCQRGRVHDIQVSKEHKFKILEQRSVSIRARGQSHLFHLDKIFTKQTTQQEMFENVGKQIIEDALSGYNGTIFAYGQTGSGKTHTLFGEMADPKSIRRGIIPRACEYLFGDIRTARDVSNTKIQCSLIEIYQNQLFDLLNANGDKLAIRQRVDNSIYVQGVSEVVVKSMDDVFELLAIGSQNRKVAETRLNHVSSRSHAILTLQVQQTLKSGEMVLSKLNFVDLAGSERVKVSGAVGDRLNEASAINKSLSALGNVIKALTTNKEHIPYRDSKLTYLLQDALGGNSKTSLVVTCSSDKDKASATVDSLRFAKRAKQMTNNVKVNIQITRKKLMKINEQYKKKLQKADDIIAKLTKMCNVED